MVLDHGKDIPDDIDENNVSEKSKKSGGSAATRKARAYTLQLKYESKNIKKIEEGSGLE